MDLSRLGRNLLFALVIFVIIGSIGHADLPATQRVEEYVAYVLTTDFDYERWLDAARASSWLPEGLDWGRWWPWRGGAEAPAGASPESSGPDLR